MQKMPPVNAEIPSWIGNGLDAGDQSHKWIVVVKI